MRILCRMREAVSQKPLWAALVVLCAVLLFTSLAPCFQKQAPPPWPELWHFADSGAPMLFAADGYHYLERAEYALREGRNGDIPLLSLAAAQCAAITTLSLERTAFFLPLLFSLGLAAVALAWGALLRLPWSIRITGMAAGLMVPAWLERSGPGWFDTDPPIAFLWQTLIVCLALAAARPARLKTAMAYCGIILCAILLPLVWKPGLGLVALALGLWLVLPANQGGCPHYAARTRMALLAFMLLAALFCLLAPDSILPRFIAVAREYLMDHISLAFGEKREDFYRSVAELDGLSGAAWQDKLGGSWFGGSIVLMSAAAAFFSHPPLRHGLWLSLPFLLLGFLAERFLYLGLFLPGLSVGLFPASLSFLSRTARRGALPGIVAWCAVLVFFLSSAAWSLTRSYAIYWQRPHDELALQLRHAAPEGAGLWNWWDDGYFLQARTGLTPLFHGGSQNARMAAIAARPLAMDDPLAARRWIRFFALHANDDLAFLDRVWGADKTLDNLERLFRSPDTRNTLVTMTGTGKNKRWFFPEGRVFLFLPKRFLDISRWWIRAGIPDREIPEQNHIESLPAADFDYDPVNRRIRPPRYLAERGYKGFGAVFAVDRAPLGPPWPTAPAPYLIYSPDAPLAYIVDEAALPSLALRLFTASSAPVPGFAPVAVNPAWGGVWEVLP